MADCLPCHFEYEEEVVLPYLPLFWQRWLLAEHTRIRNRGYRAAEVIAHARAEMPIFRWYCPPHVVARVDADHARLEPRLLRGEDCVNC